MKHNPQRTTEMAVQKETKEDWNIFCVLYCDEGQDSFYNVQCYKIAMQMLYSVSPQVVDEQIILMQSGVRLGCNEEANEFSQFSIKLISHCVIVTCVDSVKQ